MMRPSATANGPRKPSSGEFADQPGEIRRELVPRQDAAAGRRHVPERIEAGAHVDAVGRDAARLHQRGEFFAASRVSRGDVEVDGDAGIEIDAVEHALERLRASCRGRSRWR